MPTATTLSSPPPSGARPRRRSRSRPAPAATQYPAVLTDAAGPFARPAPAAFNTNGNGRIDPDKGRVVVTGRTVTALGLPLLTPLSAPVNAAMVTPLTTLLVEFMDRHGL